MKNKPFIYKAIITFEGTYGVRHSEYIFVATAVATATKATTALSAYLTLHKQLKRFPNSFVKEICYIGEIQA